MPVDLCCAMLVLPAARAASDKAMALLIYNFCAFAMQLPIGVLADRYGGGRYFSAIGCLMVALGGCCPHPCSPPSYAGWATRPSI